MFGKIASDMLGISDIGRVISPKDYNKVDSDDYIFHEDDEKIYFLIKSKTDEYCFTNKAFIHLDGTSAMSKKRMLKRYEYYKHTIDHVRIETAGTVDLDCELKFIMGPESFSIDIHKQDIEHIKDIYKSLIQISEITASNDVRFKHAHESLDAAVRVLGSNRTESEILYTFKSVNQYAFDWLNDAKKEYQVKDFGFVFEKYIKE